MARNKIECQEIKFKTIKKVIKIADERAKNLPKPNIREAENFARKVDLVHLPI